MHFIINGDKLVMGGSAADPTITSVLLFMYRQMKKSGQCFFLCFCGLFYVHVRESGAANQVTQCSHCHMVICFNIQ